MPSTVRVSLPLDLDALIACDPVAQQNPSRRDLLARAIAAGTGYVIAVDSQILGYALLEYSFFEQGFISLLVIHPDHRRQGLGSSLLHHLESLCTTPKLFTSTNLSNLPMQALLAKSGYILSGVIHNLDEGDPELIYVKFLKGGA